MRQWHVDPKTLCRKHLLGEHVEHHMFVGTINKGVCVDGYTRDGLLDPDTLHIRHKELADEMERRGFNHGSPLPPVKWDLYDKKNKFPRNEYRVDPRHNYTELARRCEACADLQKQNSD